LELRNPISGAVSATAASFLIPFVVHAASIEAGDILVADTGSTSIIKIDADTGAQTVISSGGLLEFPLSVTGRAGARRPAIGPGPAGGVRPRAGHEGATLSGAAACISRPRQPARRQTGITPARK